MPGLPVFPFGYRCLKSNMEKPKYKNYWCLVVVKAELSGAL